MGWCWRRCLSEEVVDGEDGDDIGYYPLCWGVFLLFFFWGEGLSFSRLSVGMIGMMIMMMNGKHICPHEMVFFSFSSYIYLVQRTDFFFCLSHPRSLYV